MYYISLSVREYLTEGYLLMAFGREDGRLVVVENKYTELRKRDTNTLHS